MHILLLFVIFLGLQAADSDDISTTVMYRNKDSMSEEWFRIQFFSNRISADKVTPVPPTSPPEAKPSIEKLRDIIISNSALSDYKIRLNKFMGIFATQPTYPGKYSGPLCTVTINGISKTLTLISGRVGLEELDSIIIEYYGLLNNAR